MPFDQYLVEDLVEDLETLLEALLPKLTMPAESVANLSFVHGTRADIDNFIDGPKNYDIGYGGSGLNVAQNTPKGNDLATRYTYYSRGMPPNSGKVLQGRINPEAKLRVAKIVFDPKITKVNFATGEFPYRWASNDQLHTFMKTNFDMIIFENARGFLGGDDVFYVVHESAVKRGGQRCI